MYARSAIRVAQVDRSAVPDGSGTVPTAQTDGDPADLGDWETSGILDVSSLFGEEAGELFIFDVQAHSLRDGDIESLGLVQGGQLAFLEQLDTELVSFASLPADTFADGPVSGQFITSDNRETPFDSQPVQGFSGVQFAPDGSGSFLFLSDNGFGAQDNSADYLLRLYQVDPNFAGIEAGDGSVTVENFIQLADPNNLIPFDIINEGTTERLLTGADFDIESFVIDGNGDIWIGDEFGPYLLHFDSEGNLLEAPIATPNIPTLNTLNGQEPIVIGHRGASGELPEHTLEAYALAIEQGADFIEPDLVITSDGVLIARHEPLLDDTTNVAEVFGEERQATKILDGVETTGYFAEDFTLEEIKQLRAVQSRDFRDQSFNGEFEIPTFQEVIELVQQVEADTGNQVGIYPETKHPTFFDLQGLSLEEPLIATLQETGFTDPNRIFIQSFEFKNLIELQGQLDAVGLGDLPLVQLYGNTTDSASPDSTFSVPFDIRYNVLEGNDLEAIYGQAFLNAAENPLNEDTLYSDLDSPEFLQVISDLYAEGTGPWKNNFLLRESLDEPVDGNGDGVAEITNQLTGEVTSFVDDAHDAGLQVHPFTLRNEEQFLTLNPDGTAQTPEEEFEQLIQIGVDGFFTDFPATGDEVRDQVVAEFVASPQNPDGLPVNLSGSRGFEGMAFSPDRSTLYPMLEGAVLGDPDNALRIYEFDVASSSYTGLVGFYGLEDPSHAIGDFTPINDEEFLVIERDQGQDDTAEFKKIYKIDITEVNASGFVEKELVADLLVINDPNDLNGDGDTTFDFPFVTIEDVLVLDENTILVASDNNYPFSIGRGPNIDNNEIIVLELEESLDVDPLIFPDSVDTPDTPPTTGEVDTENLFSFADDLGDDVSVRINLTGIEGSQVQQLGVSTFSEGQSVEDIVANGEIIFSTPYADSFQLFADAGLSDDLSRIITGFAGGEEVVFYLIDGETVSLGTVTEADNTLTIAFDTATANLEVTEEEPPIGASNNSTSLVDLTGFAGQALTATVSVAAESEFDNTGGFYGAVDADGTVIDPVSGASLAPGDTGYVEAAIAQAVVTFGETDSTTISVDGGTVLIPFALADGSEFYSTVFSNDGLDHFISLGDNTFGFEDLPGLGDADYDDIVFAVDFLV